MPFVYGESEALRQQLENIYSGHGARDEAMKAVGSLLYNALFPRSLYKAWERSRNQLPEGAELRLRLNIRPPALSRLPWELLYDADDGYFLATRAVGSSQRATSPFLVAPLPTRKSVTMSK